MQAGKKTFLGGWGWVGVFGLAENKANSAQLELELGLSLAKNTFVALILKHPVDV